MNAVKLKTLTDAELRTWIPLAQAEYERADATEADLDADEVFGACLTEMQRRAVYRRT